MQGVLQQCIGESTPHVGLNRVWKPSYFCLHIDAPSRLLAGRHSTTCRAARPPKTFHRLRYPLMGGRYKINGMTIIVSRGAGTWGPRMRLWKPGEILRVTLHVKK